MKRHLFYLCCYLAAALFIVSCGDPLSPSANMSVKTRDAISVTCIGAVLRGEVKASGEDPSSDLEIGILYSEESGVLLNTATCIKAAQDSIQWDRQRASFSVRIKYVKPETKYYYRCYVSRDGVIEYGKTKSFKTKPVSSLIQTLEVTELGAQEGTFHGGMDLTDIECKYFYYGFKLKADNDTYWRSFLSDNYSEGLFSSRYTYLRSLTEYSYYAYVVLDGHVLSGDIKRISVGPISASVTVGEAIGITETKASLSGTVTVQSPGDYYRAVRLCYSTSELSVDSLFSLGQSVDIQLRNDYFSANLSNLEPGVKYYYAAYATVEDSYQDKPEYSFRSDVKSFSTLDFSAEISTAEAFSIGCWTATLSGTLTVSSVEQLNKETKFYFSSQANTRESLISAGTEADAIFEDNVFKSDLGDLEKNTTYYYLAFANVCGRSYFGEVKTFKTRDFSGSFVDMGLSVKWATSNLGSLSPEDTGGYYAWGETAVKQIYDWGNYIYCNGSGTRLTKYSTSYRFGLADKKKVLEAEDDAATVALGQGARIPTQAEWAELFNTKNSTWVWEEQNGVYGMKVTSKITGGVIFLPILDGGYGAYWSSTLYTISCDSAYILRFDASSASPDSSAERCSGLPVRPVSTTLK